LSDLEVSVDSGVATLRFNRPRSKNAFTLEMIDGCVEAVRRYQHDDAVRVLVLTGSGDAFCAGADFAVLGRAATPYARKTQLVNGIQTLALAMADFDKPAIAAMNGSAVGAGLDIALMCDMRIAVRTATLSTGYIRVGVVPGGGAAYYLPRLVGVAKALELLLTGDRIGAAEAQAIGLVNRVCDPGELAEQVDRLAGTLLGHGPIPLAMIKRAVYHSMHSDLRTSLDLISSHMGIVHGTEDAKEAIAAFREKREPAFRGA
jgi:enoyl-CoA hydratase/carnithine racemase